MRMPQPGDNFEGKYEIVETLGQGGFAHVYRAHDLEVGRDVAIKILTPRDIGGYDPKLESRFTREARVIAGLQDPHTITMYEFGTSPDGLMYMVFEYVRGRDLSEVLKEQSPLPPNVVEHVLRQLLSALGEAHSRGVLHRDIKPANVIVFAYMDDPWRVKLLDFGIAKPMPEPGRDVTQLTQDGAVIGTPRYMAPEQFFGEKLTPRVDIYGLGLLTYELLVGRPAISGTTSQDTLRIAISPDRFQIPPIPGAETLIRVIAQMIEREPANRFGSADEVLAALDAARYASMERSTTGRQQPLSYSDSDGFPTTPRSHSDSYSSRPALTTRTRRTRASSLLLFGLGLASLVIVGAIGLIVRHDRTAGNEPVAPPVRQEVPFVTQATSPEPPESEPEAVPTHADDMGAGDGCGSPAERIGFLKRRADLGFGSGNYTVYVPVGYDPHRRHSVVILFHNALGSGRKVIENTRYDEIARREQIVLIAPTSKGETTRPWYSPDDPELVRVAYEQTREELCLDDDHVYGLGHGGGGNFTMDLRCQFRMSAIAFTAAGEHTTQSICETSDPVPAMRMWGNTDRHVPPEGGVGCWDQNTFRSADEIRGLWQKRNGTGGKGKVWVDLPGGVCTVFEGAATYVDCELNGGHDWPTSPAKLELPNCAAPPPDFPVGDTIWNFFSEFGVARTDAQQAEPSE